MINQMFDDYYDRIALTKGRFGLAVVRESIRSFWACMEAEGAEYLVARLCVETDPVRQEAVANLLADVGDAARNPIVEALHQGGDVDRIEWLLKALRWIGPLPEDYALVDRLIESMTYYVVEAGDEDVRDAAMAVVAIIPKEKLRDYFIALIVACEEQAEGVDSEVLDAEVQPGQVGTEAVGGG